MTGVLTITAYGLREALRRRVFTVVLLLTVAFLVLFWLATRYVFDHIDEIQPPVGVDARTFAGAFLLGLAMFATLFLGVVLAVFLTAESCTATQNAGSCSRSSSGPWGARRCCSPGFSARLWSASLCAPGLLRRAADHRRDRDWWPDRVALLGLELALGVLVVAALSLLGSIFLGPTANGIAIFMVFGAGLVAGLLGNIGDALDAEKRVRVARDRVGNPVRGALSGRLRAITADTSGITGFVLQLGLFGGASTGGWELRVYAAAYLVLVLVVAVVTFARRDL